MTIHDYIRMKKEGLLDAGGPGSGRHGGFGNEQAKMGFVLQKHGFERKGGLGMPGHRTALYEHPVHGRVAISEADDKWQHRFPSGNQPAGKDKQQSGIGGDQLDNHLSQHIGNWEKKQSDYGYDRYAKGGV